MNDQINYKNNPLHGVSLKNLLIEMVEHYGFEILYAYLNINCFKTNPSVDSSIKFLKKTDWAREKVEAFYLYQFKSLPRASEKQFLLPPRDRIVPEDQSPGEPAALSLEDAERLREKRSRKSAQHGQGPGYRSGSGRNFGARDDGGYSAKNDSRAVRKQVPKISKTSDVTQKSASDPWSKWKNR